MNCRLNKVGATITSFALLATLAIGAVPANASQNAVKESVAQVALTSTDKTILNNQKSQIIEFEKYINELRAEHGLGEVKFNANASVEAYNWSKTMGTGGEFRHTTDSEVDRESVTYYSRRNENIASSGSTSVSSMFTQWKTSDSHRANMLDPSATSFGVGFYTANGKTFGTTLLHTAKSTGYMPETYRDASSYYSGANSVNTANGTTIAVPAPTVNKTNKTYTVPSVNGVRYYNSYQESFVPAGTYKIYGDRLHLTAVMNDGYKSADSNIITNGGWSWRFNENIYMDAYSPYKPTVVGTTVSLPYDEYINYYVNGVLQYGYEFDASKLSTVKVTATVKDDYSDWLYLDEYEDGWELNIGTKRLTAKPVFIDNQSLSYTVPSVSGVQYLVNGTVRSAGTYKVTAGSTISVVVKPLSGYYVENVNTFNFSHKFASSTVVPPPAVKTVTPSAPSFNTTNMTYTIPTTTGVTYKVNGTTVSSGTRTASYSTTYKVTAHANSGYALSGTSSWSKAYGTAPLESVTPSAPSFNTTNMTYTIPTTTGVTYKVNGTTVSAGTHKASYSTTYKVTAHANSGYVLSGTSSWSKAYGASPIINVTPKDPTTNVVEGTYTIPSTTGVNYYVDGVYKTAGTYSSGYKNIAVTTKAISSKYALSGINSWSFKLAKINATPKTPTTDIAKKKLTLPFVSGVNYYVNGKFTKAGTYSAYSYTTVIAKASAKNYNVKETTWKFDYRTSVKPTAPKAKPSYITIPQTNGVKYYVNGTLRNAGTYKVSGYVKVTTSAYSANYKLSGTTLWSYRFSTPARPANNASGNTITIPSTAGVNYYINNKLVKAGTHKNYGGYYTVTTKPVNSATFLSGTQSWKIDNRNSVTPTKVTWSASKNQIYIPKKTGVNYYINGTSVKAGTHSNRGGYYTVTAKASSGSYKLAGTQSWKVDNRNSVTPTKVTWSASKNHIYIPKKTGVKYYINGTYVSAKTHSNRGGYYTVTAKASNSSYKLAGTQSWKVDNRNSVKPKAPTFSTGGNSVKIYASTGVKYYVNGVYKKPGTYKYKNGTTLKVTTKVSSSSYKLAGTQSWTKKI